MKRPPYIALFASVAAAAALFGAPLAFADGGHGDHVRGRDGDDRVLVSAQNPAPAVVPDRDDEVNENNDEVQVAPAQPAGEMEVDQQVNDVNDDAD